MKQIRIKTIKLVNFKGVRNLEINFNEAGATSITGRNGSGKTTVFDAFTWCLFGKDSQDRKAFELKTIGADGKTIEKLPHEVSATITVDGSEITLCRRFTEKWTKRRGSAVEEFTGNEEERLYNDIPCSVKEWNDKISAICNEQVFKFITNPFCFSAQKTETQRAMLFRMAGEVSDEEVAFGNDDFQRLLAKLTGKTMDEFKREIAAKKSRIKKDLQDIPGRIDERKRDMPEAEDWNALRIELEGHKAELAKVEGMLSDKAKAYADAGEMRVSKSMELSEVRQKIAHRESELRSETMKGYYEEKLEKEKMVREFASNNAEANRRKSAIDEAKKSIAALNSSLDELRQQWRTINDSEITFNDADFVCPTCGRPFETADIEAKKAEMRANFNTKKANDLKRNSEQGKKLKAQRDELEEKIAEDEAEMGKANDAAERIKANPLYSRTLTEPDCKPVFASDAMLIKLHGQQSALEQAFAEVPSAPDDEDLKRRKSDIEACIEAVKARLAKKEIIEKTEIRIAELETQYRTLSQEQAELEGIEFSITQFGKAKVEAVESRINGLFSLVKFKMYDTQINGGEVETCEATVNGVPYSALNNAMQINAGLDIINTICKSEGVSAPIFIDNCEAVLEPLQTESQQVRLYVADTEFTIK